MHEIKNIFKKGLSYQPYQLLTGMTLKHLYRSDRRARSTSSAPFRRNRSHGVDEFAADAGRRRRQVDGRALLRRERGPLHQDPLHGGSGNFPVSGSGLISFF